MKKIIIAFALILCGALCLGVLTVAFKGAKDAIDTEKDDTIIDSSDSDNFVPNPDVPGDTDSDSAVKTRTIQGVVRFNESILEKAINIEEDINFTNLGDECVHLSIKQGANSPLISVIDTEGNESTINNSNISDVTFDFGDEPQTISDEFYNLLYECSEVIMEGCWLFSSDLIVKESHVGTYDFYFNLLDSLYYSLTIASDGTVYASDDVGGNYYIYTDGVLDDNRKIIDFNKFDSYCSYKVYDFVILNAEPYGVRGVYTLTRLASGNFTSWYQANFIYNGMECNCVSVIENEGLYSVYIGNTDTCEPNVIFDQAEGSSINIVLDFGDIYQYVSEEFLEWLNACVGIETPQAVSYSLRAPNEAVTECVSEEEEVLGCTAGTESEIYDDFWTKSY